MGITRINDLPEQAVVQTIIDARQTNRELKGSPQIVSGANLAYLVSENPGTHDWQGQLNGSVPTLTYGRARFVITLTSSRAAVPMSDLALTVYYSTDGITFTEYTLRQGMIDTYTASGPEIWRELYVRPGFEYGPGEVQYSLDLFGKLDSHVAYKLQVVGMDEVTISVARVY